MPAESAAGAKQRLRACERRTSREESSASGAAAQQRLLALPELSAAGTVSLYVGHGSEVPTDLLFHELVRRGTRVALPRVGEDELALRELSDASDLEAGYAGIPEPGTEAPTISPKEIDLFVVPGVRFDRAGGRLGRGGGHFDRLLARARPGAVRVGLCYASQIVEQVPTDDWDERMDILVAESAVIRVEGRGR